MKFIRSLYFKKQFFIYLLIIAFLFVSGTWLPWLAILANIALMLLVLSMIIELVLLYGVRNGLSAGRQTPALLSNGDKNLIRLKLINHYRFPVYAEIVDEIPAIFQIRDFRIKSQLPPRSEKREEYLLKPVKRGEFTFGRLNIFVSTVFRLLQRKYFFEQGNKIKVYPSFQQVKNIEFYSFAKMKNRLGTKRVRRPGQNREFEHIKDYLPGDEPRHINWKATARKSKLMVNDYQEEKAQNIYSLIDMGRGMEMAFHGMTFLDYAINASLAIGRVALTNKDRFGLITYTNQLQQYLPAESRNNQFSLLLESLYKQETDFRESSLESVLGLIRSKIHTRSLLIIYTNYMSRYSIEREIDYLKNLAARHLVLLVTFENTRITEFIRREVNKLDGIYTQTVAESFAYEKKVAINELSRYGIQHLITPPRSLSIETINKYLEIKAGGLL